MIAPAAETVVVSGGVLEAIAEHAKRETPNECCGLLIGTAGRIEDSVPTTNVAYGASRFTVDPRQHIALAKRLRGSGREIVGAYHSHPRSPAVPSPTDVAESYYPEFVHVIVSLMDPLTPDLRAYRIRGTHVASVALVIDADR